MIFLMMLIYLILRVCVILHNEGFSYSAMKDLSILMCLP
jgi:hypothetical protein